MLRSALDAVLTVVFAPACVVCERLLDAPTGGVVCPGCWRSVVCFTPPLCEVCGAPVVDARRCQSCHAPVGDLLIIRARAVGPYDGVLRAVVHALKYDCRRSLAMPLARLMRQMSDDLLVGVDVAVPVPLHRSRLRERGFNQALDLARELGVPVADALSRVEATPSQTGLSREQRLRNVRAAFRLNRNATSAVRNRIILLVDDVCTTGATLEACARVIRAAGAREVRALTAARTQ